MMGGPSCSICFNAFCEEGCVPKFLDCGHSVCFKCLDTLLRSQKACPTCRATLSKALDEYQTNFDLLKLSTNLKENNSSHPNDLSSLETKKNVIVSKKVILKKLIDKRTSLQKDVTDNIDLLQKDVTDNIALLQNDVRDNIALLQIGIADNITKFQESLHKEIDLFNIDEVNNEISKIDDHLEKLDDPEVQNILHLNQYNNTKHFLYDIVVRLEEGEVIYACDMIGKLGCRYGKVTFRDDRLHIHCLSSSTTPKDSLIVWFQDIRICIKSKENIVPFIEVGTQKLFFTLTDDSFIWTLELLRYCTGEAGRTIMGSNAVASEFIRSGQGTSSNDASQNNSSVSANLNRLSLFIDTPSNGCGYEHALIQGKSYKGNIGDVVLLCFQDEVSIIKIPDANNFYNVVAKLHENCEIDFKDMLGMKVEDCGISFNI